MWWSDLLTIAVALAACSSPHPTDQASPCDTDADCASRLCQDGFCCGIPASGFSFDAVGTVPNVPNGCFADQDVRVEVRIGGQQSIDFGTSRPDFTTSGTISRIARGVRPLLMLFSAIRAGHTVVLAALIAYVDLLDPTRGCSTSALSPGGFATAVLSPSDVANLDNLGPDDYLRTAGQWAKQELTDNSDNFDVDDDGQTNLDEYCAGTL